MGIGAAIIGGSVVSGVLGSRSSRRASDAQSRAADASIAEQRRQFDIQQELLRPFREAGVDSVNQLRDLLIGGDLSSFQTSPDFNFVRGEGLEGIAQTLGAGGQGAFSGNALRALNEFNTNLASGEFGNFVNRRLALAGLGGNAAAGTANAAANTGANVGNALLQQGNARASGILGGGIAANQGINGILTALLLRNQGLLGGGNNSDSLFISPALIPARR